MIKSKSDNKVSQKWKSYFTGLINSSNLMSSNKTDKYFRYPISESTVKAIHENWIRILGIDYEIISMNLCKEGKPLGIALEGKYDLIGHNVQNSHHFLRAIKPNLCIGMSCKFMVRDELLEVSGLKIMGLSTKDVIHALKKVTNNFQIVVARPLNHNYELASDYGGSEDNINSPLSFYNTDEDNDSNHTGTLRSVTSNYSTTSRDFGSNVSFSGMIDGQFENVKEYLRNIDGWRGPVILEFRKHKESLGLALEEIPDPMTSEIVIVFKVVVPNMIAGKDGRLHVGDRLLQVNGKSVAGIHFRKVCQWMKSSHGGRLILCICKPHFASININNSDQLYGENLFDQTMDQNKLPKLTEEGNSCEIPSAPEYLEKQITLKKKNNKLGLYLDVVDNGQNGARIKKVDNRGIAKEDGRLHEGDHLVRINDVNLRVNDKIKLGYCLKQIEKDNVFNIWYITGEDISLVKTKCLENPEVAPPISKIYPNTNSVKFVETSQESLLESSYDDNLSFRIIDIQIRNDFESQLGLVITPSLNDPTRFKSVTHIHQGSLAEKSQLRINDEILMVNDVNLENMSIAETGEFLKKVLELSSSMDFRIRRMISPEDEDDIEDPLESTRIKVSQLPDIYCVSIEKSGNNYGFSILELEDSNGMVVEKIHPDSVLSKKVIFKTGHRFAMINQCPVIGSSKTTMMGLVKKSSGRLNLVMEIVKYREFLVKITKDSALSLGLNIGGGIDTTIPIPIIESLVPNRKSKFSEPLFPSDYIMEVDGNKLTDLSHDDIITILRSTGAETTFKICRPLPYLKRGLFGNLESPEFPHDYLRDCQYSISISKPVDSISTFGITLTDVVILAENAAFTVLARYKAVLHIKRCSLAEKYAPEIKPNHFLVAINSVPIDCDISCDDLKAIIDSGRNVDLVFSKDIPYRLVEIEKDHDSPVLLRNSQPLSHSDNSSEEDLNNQSRSENLVVDNRIEDVITENPLATPQQIEDPNSEIVSDSLPQIDKSDIDENEQLEVKGNEKVNDSEDCRANEESLEKSDPSILINKDNIENDDENKESIREDNIQSDLKNCDFNDLEADQDQPKEPALTIDTDLSASEQKVEDKEPVTQSIDKIDVESEKDEQDGPAIKETASSEPDGPISELGINIDCVTLVKLDNVELGFHLYGGLHGGPSGETIPVFVIGAEKNSCNWPADQQEPLLKNGTQLIEFNGSALSALPLATIEQMIRTTSDTELVFRVVTFK